MKMASSTRVSGYECLARLRSCEKAMGLCTATDSMIRDLVEVSAQVSQSASYMTEQQRQQ